MLCNSCKSCKAGELVKILPANGSTSNHLDVDTLRICNISSPKELDEYVVFQSSMYGKIFGEKKIKASNSKKRLSIVKICYEGRSIHRAYLSASAKDFDKDYVALTPNSIYELSSEKAIVPLSKVTVCKGCVWKFYWNNPNAAVRMSFRIGIIGIIASVMAAFLFTMFSKTISNLV